MFAFNQITQSDVFIVLTAISQTLWLYSLKRRHISVGPLVTRILLVFFQYDVELMAAKMILSLQNPN